MPLLVAKDLTKCYTVGKETVTVLDHVSFSVEEGEFIAIMGASGSGKSTLLHLLGCVDTPTHGRLTVDGADVFSLSDKERARYRRQKVSLIYQFYNLLPMLNVRENMLLPCELDGRVVEDAAVVRILRLLHLSDREFYYPHELSGGQQQRVAIGRALLTAPKILLSDEPTGNLDSVNTAEVLSLLREANRTQKQTVLLVTHDKEVAKYADRILTLSDGRLVSDETL